MVKKWDTANQAADQATRIFQASISKATTLIITIFLAVTITGTIITAWLLRGG
jgi:hypothetical protein